MADTAPKVPARECEESDDAVDRKADELVALIRRSKHFIVFTGAGVSTSAGIADFRGPQGVWTLQAQGRESAIRSIDTQQALPTPTHMALVELQNRGVMKYLVSQNCDGLHRRSGILPDRISELHGNSNLEYCRDCGKEYLRDFRAEAPDHRDINDHRTGRKCALCPGVLLDTIIHFGEYLPEVPLDKARKHAEEADLCLVLGSSLTVPPACTIPEIVSRGPDLDSSNSSSNKAKKNKKGETKMTMRTPGALVICNLQETPLDELADLRIHAKADLLMEKVMGKLGYSIPPFVLRRRLVVQRTVTEKDGSAGGSRFSLTISGVDVDGTPASFLRSVKCAYNRRLVKSEPFVIQFRGDVESALSEGIRLELQFMGHYGEPNLEVTYYYRGEQDNEKVVYLLEYSLDSGSWSVQELDIASG